MDGHKIRQLNIVNNAIHEFENGFVSLGSLISTMEAILPIVDDPSFGDAIFPQLVALEEVNARLGEGNFDFDRYGRPVIDKAR